MWEEKTYVLGMGLVQAHVVHYFHVLCHCTLCQMSLPDEEWTLFMWKCDSTSEGYSPKLYIGGKVVKYIYIVFQLGASISNINGQFMVTRTL